LTSTPADTARPFAGRATRGVRRAGHRIDGRAQFVDERAVEQVQGGASTVITASGPS